MAELLAELAAGLRAAGDTSEGARVVAGHDEDFELSIVGHGMVHVAVANGSLSVQPGSSPRQRVLQFTRLELDAQTAREIITGQTSPVEAMSRGSLLLRTRLYGGAVITILLRIAYDLARSRMLGNGKTPGERSGG